MLLDKHGGHRDQGRRQREGPFPAPGAKGRGVPGGKHHRQRADHMDGGADVGVCIKAVKPGHEAGQNIVPFKAFGAQLLAVGKDEIDQQRRCVCNDDEFHHPGETLRVIEEGVDQHPSEKHEPEQIGEQKQFTEGDQVVQGAVHAVIGHGLIKALHKQKQQPIDRPVQQQLHMPELRRIQVGETELSVICDSFFHFILSLLFHRTDR